jgi:hypothetical protein
MVIFALLRRAHKLSLNRLNWTPKVVMDMAGVQVDLFELTRLNGLPFTDFDRAVCQIFACSDTLIDTLMDDRCRLMPLILDSTAITADRLVWLFFCAHQSWINLLRRESLRQDVYVKTKTLLFYLDVLLSFWLWILFCRGKIWVQGSVDVGRGFLGEWDVGLDCDWTTVPLWVDGEFLYLLQVK